MSCKKIRPRNPYVAPAKQRSGAGAMHDRRAPKGGARNQQSEDLGEWEEEAESADADNPRTTDDAAEENAR